MQNVQVALRPHKIVGLRPGGSFLEMILYNVSGFGRLDGSRAGSRVGEVNMETSRERCFTCVNMSAGRRRNGEACTNRVRDQEVGLRVNEEILRSYYRHGRDIRPYLADYVPGIRMPSDLKSSPRGSPSASRCHSPGLLTWDEVHLSPTENRPPAFEPVSLTSHPTIQIPHSAPSIPIPAHLAPPTEPAPLLLLLPLPPLAPLLLAGGV